MAMYSTFTRPPWIAEGSSFTLISILSLSPWKQAAFCHVLGSAGSGLVPSESTHLAEDQIHTQNDAIGLPQDVSVIYVLSDPTETPNPQHLLCLRQHVFTERKVPD